MDKATLTDNLKYYFRILVSAILVGAISFGNTIQASASNETAVTSWQIKSALLGAIVLALNDIKSRMTPTQIEEKK